MCAGHGRAGALPPGAADWDAGRAQEGGGSAAEETPHGECELTSHCSPSHILKKLIRVKGGVRLYNYVNVYISYWLSDYTV